MKSIKEIPSHILNFNYKHFFIRLYEKAFYEDIFSRAAQVAFYFSFAIFPLLLFLITLFGIILESADDFRLDMFRWLRQIMPFSAYKLVESTITEVMNASSGGKLTIGLLIAIWSASAGIDSLRIALNGVYDLKETRWWWTTKAISIALTIGLAVLIFIALGIIFYGSHLIVWTLSLISVPIPSPFFLRILQWVTIFVVLLLAFVMLYVVCPNHSPRQWKFVTPGSLIGIILWVLFSSGFRTYLQYFDTYAKTYGSLGAMIILMFWLYLTALVILTGGAINAIFEEFADVKRANRDEERLAAEKELRYKSLGEVMQDPKH
jgi:membrane protein